MGKDYEILQLRADAFALSQRILDLRHKGLKGPEIGVDVLRILYTSDYEYEMLRLWYVLNQKQSNTKWSVQEVDGALIRSNFDLMRIERLTRQIIEDVDTTLTKRFFDELTGIKLPTEETIDGLTR